MKNVKQLMERMNEHGKAAHKAVKKENYEKADNLWKKVEQDLEKLYTRLGYKVK